VCWQRLCTVGRMLRGGFGVLVLQLTQDALVEQPDPPVVIFVNLAVLVVQLAAVALCDLVVIDAVRNVDLGVKLSTDGDLALHPVGLNALHAPVACDQGGQNRLLHLFLIGMEGAGSVRSGVTSGLLVQAAVASSARTINEARTKEGIPFLQLDR
jgi:hypothetical protein